MFAFAYKFKLVQMYYPKSEILKTFKIVKKIYDLQTEWTFAQQ